MFKKIKKGVKFIISKTTNYIAKKTVRWGFWVLLCFLGPGSVITTIGVKGLITAAVVTHSGIIEYTTNKAVVKMIGD